MIVQRDNSTLDHRLRINQTTDRLGPVSIVVEEIGLYQVTILAIRKNDGIKGSNVEFHSVISDQQTSTTTPTPTTGG